MVGMDLRNLLINVEKITHSRFYKSSHHKCKSKSVQGSQKQYPLPSTEINAPWPLNNRDLYADIKVTRDSSMHSMRLVSPGVNGFFTGEKGSGARSQIESG